MLFKIKFFPVVSILFGFMASMTLLYMAPLAAESLLFRYSPHTDNLLWWAKGGTCCAPVNGIRLAEVDVLTLSP